MFRAQCGTGFLVAWKSSGVSPRGYSSRRSELPVSMEATGASAGAVTGATTSSAGAITGVSAGGAGGVQTGWTATCASAIAMGA